ncbi:MAG TPA: cytochrome P450 [Myxococcota bacterium]|nr:cytochrome P450 [Myxococcota bacterium]
MEQPKRPAVFGIADDAFRANPYPVLNMLREAQPLVKTPLGLWGLARYDDVGRLLRDVRCGMRKRDGTPFVIPDVGPGERFDPNAFMLLQDGAPHTRLRKLVAKAFTPRMVERLRPEVQAVCDACVERVLAKGTLDVAEDVARIVPSTVICLMLGVPLADRPRFTEWTANATHALVVQFAPTEAMARARPALEKLVEYFEAMIEARRKNLGEDLVSELIRAEEDGDRLTSAELLVQSVGLLAAGFETTIGLISLGMRQLLLHPDQLAKLRADPGLIGSAVEECLRFDPPILATLRVLHEDVEWHGQTLPADTPILAMLGAANRDPRAFEDPERFDIARRGAPHWGFGGGAHFCLGAHLARLETQAAIGTLVRRLPSLSLGDEPLKWSDSLFRVPASLPVRFEAP